MTGRDGERNALREPSERTSMQGGKQLSTDEDAWCMIHPTLFCQRWLPISHRFHKQRKIAGGQPPLGCKLPAHNRHNWCKRRAMDISTACMGAAKRATPPSGPPQKVRKRFCWHRPKRPRGRSTSVSLVLMQLHHDHREQHVPHHHGGEGTVAQRQKEQAAHEEEHLPAAGLPRE